MMVVNPHGQAAPAAEPGQTLFLANGTFNWPAGIDSACVVAICRGSDGDTDGEAYATGGQGGSLRYVNNISREDGTPLTIVVDDAGYGQQHVTISRGATVLCKASLNPANMVGTGFNGSENVDPSETGTYRGGGGAGGFTSAGRTDAETGYGGGEGVSPYGGGAGGRAGMAAGSSGGTYGGGGAAGYEPGYGGALNVTGQGGPGCAYILWGPGRAFPNTNTAPV